MYIIISTPIPPKKSPIFGKVFSEYFLRQITNRHTFLCGSVEVWKMKIAILPPFFPKKVDTHFSRRYREDKPKIAPQKTVNHF
mgnify:CR=1 FL=1